MNTEPPADFLAAMAVSSAQRAAAARARLPLAELHATLRDRPPPPRWTPSPGGFDLIAEVKWRSPAAGALGAASATELEARISAYVEAGAAAISVLTEPSRFDGSLDHLRAVGVQMARGVSSPPTMRKDFLVDPYQILEARACGAGGVLLIVRMLDSATLATMIETAREQNLFVLLEVFDEHDLERMLAVLARFRSTLDGQILVGVNCRDLVTLEVVPGRLETLVTQLPDELPRVAESGVSSAEDARRLAAAGYDAALVGSALMTTLDPLGLARAMLQAARSVHAEG